MCRLLTVAWGIATILISFVCSQALVKMPLLNGKPGSPLAESLRRERDRLAVFCSFHARVLKKALQDHIAGLGRIASWPDILADLESLTETKIEPDAKPFLVRSAPRQAASLALQATGVALPPTVRSAVVA
jgi:hypothetical protein